MSRIKFSREVRKAIEINQPLVALETAVVTHGLPYPSNLEVARGMENIIREEGAAPATIAVYQGALQIGLKDSQLETLAADQQAVKISRRDFGPALLGRKNGGTTVAGTLTALGNTGIKVFATGGIGGVHRGSPFDVAADLFTLASTPAVVVCAGAKSILDLPATLEYLETLSVPVVGYRTDDFPAFYARSSGLPVTASVDSPEEAAWLAKNHWSMGVESAVLLVVPPPAAQALEDAEMEKAVQQALAEAEEKDITGQAVTPFLLDRVSDLTGGASLEANLSLLKNNARVGARTSLALEKMD